MTGATNQKLWPWVAYPAAALALYLIVSGLWRGCQPAVELDGSTVPAAPLTDADADAAAAIVVAAYRGDTAPAGTARLAETNHGVYVALRQRGQLRTSDWHLEGTVAQALAAATSAATSAMKAPPTADTAEVCIAHTYRSHRVRGKKRFIGNIHRGVRGLELRHRDHVVRHAPTEMVARNLAFERALELLANQRELSDSDLADGAATARTFECEQLLVDLTGGGVTRMFRGNRVIEQGEVTADSVRAFEKSLGDWLLANLELGGRLTYKYWPSQGNEAPSNNMIRQWMGTIALVRLGNYYGDAEIAGRSMANIRYNLSRFYTEDQGFGLIQYQGKVKLGAVALAALAIMEHPQRDQLIDWEKKLRATTFHLQKDDGRFATFYRPKGLDANHNFYPGETLLYWALLYLREPDPALLERIMRSMRYYKQWHKDNRNPAFIPWHTQAYVNLWFETRDDELRDWVFEMNDWLLDMQDNQPSPYRDTLGRFYDKDRPKYGPPHASSTGVYLEGLIDAFRLAREVGDSARADRYREAIARGLRSSMQLQFADDVDMFYVPSHKRDRVRYGLRTTVYDNAIRVDNVQHVLLGVFRITRTFSAEDYRVQ